MDMYPKYTSPFGYQTGKGGIDTYGVNHNGFSVRDEVEYQFARDKREQELMKHYNAQGITSNYPQYTTNFWGNNADNNYGFGMANITDNIANLPQVTPILQQQTQLQNNIQPNNFATQQNPLQQIVGAVGDLTTEYFNMKNHGYKNLDDYHHCKANYNAAARGPLGYNTAKYLGDAKEKFDFYWNQLYKGKSEQEAIADRNHDLGVNAIGRLRGDSGLYNSAQDACQIIA